MSYKQRKKLAGKGIPVSRGYLERRSFIATDRSFYVALATFVATSAISLGSAWISKRSADLEREYKTLMIRPHLTATIDDSDFSVKISNNGIGPARIDRIVLSYISICSDSLYDSHFFSNYQSILRFFGKDFSDISTAIANTSPAINIRFEMKATGSVIPVSQEWKLIYASNIEDIKSDNILSAQEYWLEHYQKMRLIVFYSSMDEKFSKYETINGAVPECLTR